MTRRISFVEDLKEEFVTDFIFPAIAGNAVYERRYLLGTALTRSVIARRQVEIALREGASAVAPGTTGKGNDQVRFELAFAALAPGLEVISPWKDPDRPSPEDIFKLTRPLAEVPDEPIDLMIHFKDSTLIRVENETEGVELTDPVALFDDLNEVGGRHGIGQVDMVENSFVGIKSISIKSISKERSHASSSPPTAWALTLATTM